MTVKILNDDGPLRIEDHEDESSMRVVHKASGNIKWAIQYVPGSITSWTNALNRLRGYQRGWADRKTAQYKGDLS